MLLRCTGAILFWLNTFIERRARPNCRITEDSELDCAFEPSTTGGSGVQITLFSICVWSVSSVSAKFSCVWIYAWSALFSSVKLLLNFSIWIRAWSVPSVCNQSFIYYIYIYIDEQRSTPYSFLNNPNCLSSHRQGAAKTYWKGRWHKKREGTWNVPRQLFVEDNSKLS